MIGAMENGINIGVKNEGPNNKTENKSGLWEKPSSFVAAGFSPSLKTTRLGCFRPCYVTSDYARRLTAETGEFCRRRLQRLERESISIDLMHQKSGQTRTYERAEPGLFRVSECRFVLERRSAPASLDKVINDHAVCIPVEMTPKYHRRSHSGHNVLKLMFLTGHNIHWPVWMKRKSQTGAASGWTEMNLCKCVIKNNNNNN